MRVGGLATGMDIDSLVDQLMEAERIPLNKMQQDKQMVEWKRDGFRDVNKALLELDNMMTDMKLSKTYKTKQVTSTQSGVTATAGGKATDGSYEIEVKSLAKSAINVGESEADTDMSQYVGEHTFHTYDENGEKQDHTFEIEEGDSLSKVLKKITDNRSGNVRAFREESSGKVVIEATRTGQYNENGKEIEFGESAGSLFTEGL